jgi:hypothetical protein
VDALEFLEEVWSEQCEGTAKSAFAFLSVRTHDGGWQDLAFKVKGTRPLDILELPDPKLGDVYFCPNLFMRPRRRKELVLPSCWLYADLDTVKPPTVDDPLMRKRKTSQNPTLEPSIAWESSPGRYQALWHLDRHLRAPEHSPLNRKLTYALGADKGGWDITQVLRVPGTINHKYAQKPEVKLLWA